MMRDRCPAARAVHYSVPVTKLARPRIRVSLTPVVTVAAVLIYVAILHYAYVQRVSPMHAYQGYTYREPDTFVYACSIGLACLLALILPRRIERPSSLIAWILFIVAVVPSLVVPNLARVLHEPTDVLLSSVWLSTAFGLVAWFGTRRAVRLSENKPTIGVSPASFGLILMFASVVVYGYIIMTSGLSLSLPALDDVYDTRFDFRASAVSAPFLGYLIPLQANVINPAFILRGLYSGRRSWVILGFAGQALLYAITGQKAIILSTPVLIGVAIVFRLSKRPPAIVFVLGMTAVVFLSMLIDTLMNSRFVTSLFVRRFILTPGLLFGVYVAVWGPIEKARWGHSSITMGYIDYPYDLTPAFYVGRAFFGRSEMSANASVFADGFSNLGFPGLLLAGLALMALLWVIDHVSRGLPVAVSGIIFLIPSIGLANTALLTALLTHGLIASILVAAIMPREGWWQRPSEEKVRAPRRVRTHRA
jgi:hypothetical protein